MINDNSDLNSRKITPLPSWVGPFDICIFDVSNGNNSSHEPHKEHGPYGK